MSLLPLQCVTFSTQEPATNNKQLFWAQHRKAQQGLINIGFHLQSCSMLWILQTYPSYQDRRTVKERRKYSKKLFRCDIACIEGRGTAWLDIYAMCYTACVSMPWTKAEALIALLTEQTV